MMRINKCMLGGGDPRFRNVKNHQDTIFYSLLYIRKGRT